MPGFSEDIVFRGPLQTRFEPAGGSVVPVVDPSPVRVGARFDSLFHVERVYPVTEKHKAVGIRQPGALSTRTGRFAFT